MPRPATTSSNPTKPRDPSGARRGEKPLPTTVLGWEGRINSLHQRISKQITDLNQVNRELEEAKAELMKLTGEKQRTRPGNGAP
jgi:hypothetical protein